MDRVLLKEVRVPAVIGVYGWEREIEQTLLFSVEIEADVAKAAERDDLADAIDYSAVAESIRTVVREGRFRLIETAAERVAERLLATYQLNWLRLEVTKPLPSEGYSAAIVIERGIPQP